MSIISGTIESVQENTNLGRASATTMSAGEGWNRSALMALREETRGECGIRKGSLGGNVPSQAMRVR
jgi:hypothetical protein